MTGLKMGAGDDPSEHDEDAENQNENGTSDMNGQGNQNQNQPYIIRRHMSNGSAEFERPTRLNFFVHDDIAEGEASLLSDLRDSYSPRATKYDVREAVYRAALRNREDIREEFERLGYSSDR